MACKKTIQKGPKVLLGSFTSAHCTQCHHHDLKTLSWLHQTQRKYWFSNHLFSGGCCMLHAHFAIWLMSHSITPCHSLHPIPKHLFEFSTKTYRKTTKLFATHKNGQCLHIYIRNFKSFEFTQQNYAKCIIQINCQCICLFTIVGLLVKYKLYVSRWYIFEHISKWIDNTWVCWYYLSSASCSSNGTMSQNSPEISTEKPMHTRHINKIALKLNVMWHILNYYVVCNVEYVLNKWMLNSKIQHSGSCMRYKHNVDHHNVNELVVWKFGIILI